MEMRARAVDVSIIILARREAPNMEACLKAIYQQKFEGSLQVIVIDCGSVDRTLEIASKYPVLPAEHRVRGISSRTDSQPARVDSDILSLSSEPKPGFLELENPLRPKPAVPLVRIRF